ncbi:MAG TPA: enolase C-terminal domain-like protein [Anaerovoracaceae bacterium]|nr:enolase C-terminal domain-like protein [Anaerovoracaceae bacterium]
MNTKIKTIAARQILDCRARPALEVDICTEGGAMGRGSAPTGTSVGKYEAFVLRDGNKNDYNGLSVHKAVDIVHNIIAPALIGMDVLDQKAIDEAMIALDGTPDKRKLGGNSIYSISIACCRAAAASRRVPLYRYIAGGALKTIPLPTFNVINGGKNGNVTQAFNEFMLAPYRADSVEQAISMAIQVYWKLESIITRYNRGVPPILGRSYGWAAPTDDPSEVLELMEQAVEECGFTSKMAYALDCASSEMYDAKTGTYELIGRRVSSDELIGFAKGLTERFRLVFIEDLLDEDDWDGFVKANRELKRTIVIGDDFIATNPKRLNKAYDLKAVDGFILKPNQIGTITEALEAYDFAKKRGLLVIPSGRAGGVVGDIIADLSLGLHSEISKNGAPKSGERLDKMNHLLRASSENPGSHLHDFSKIIRF